MTQLWRWDLIPCPAVAHSLPLLVPQIVQRAQQYYTQAAPSRRAENHKEKVRSVAVQDGDASKRRATELLRKKDSLGAKKEAQRARECYGWAEINCSERGLDDVDHDIKLFEIKTEATSKLHEGFKAADRHEFSSSLSLISTSGTLFESLNDHKTCSDIKVCVDCDWLTTQMVTQCA